MAFVLLLHLGLLLIALRPPVPWFFRRAATTSMDHELRVEWLPRPRHVIVPTPVSTPRMHVSSARWLHARAIRETPSAPAMPTAAVPATEQPEVALPSAPSQATPYGNSRFTRAFDDAQSSGLPRLPGTNAIPTVPGIVVAPPPSLKSRLSDAVRLLNCKNAIFKRRMSDQELIKRGLTHQQMEKAYQEYCVP
ncbi:hypothetical protein [Dyella mobilis]|nr:hypothetical protein [Dyella mobilis]